MGASHRWHIATPEEHAVELQHATHSARAKIMVDGVTVFEQSGDSALWDDGFEHEFTIDDSPCRIRISVWWPRPRYELWVDGKLQE